MLEESVSNHGHERVAVAAVPGSPLEVVETQFFFQLLVSLLANPSRLDGGRQGAQVRLRRQVGEIVFLLSRHPVFADEPSLVAWQMLLTLVPDPLRWSVGDPHADGGKTSLELPLRTGAPTDGMPLGIGQHVFGRDRQNVRDVPLTRTTALGYRPDHLHIGRVNLEVPRNPDRGRVRQTVSLQDRLSQQVREDRDYARSLPPGKEREELLRHARRAESASQMTEWLTFRPSKPLK